jgi:hypothetical protein
MRLGFLLRAKASGYGWPAACEAQLKEVFWKRAAQKNT